MKLSFLPSDELLLVLQKGSPVLFPTDTLPALAALPKYAYKLWELKKRPKKKPLILMGSSVGELIKYVLPLAKEDAFLMASSFWPGALTMVLPALGEVSDLLNPCGTSLGLRMPASDLALEFLRKTGPLATTSANLSGQDPSIQPEKVAKYFPELPLLGPQSWPQLSGCASTLIEWEGPGKWQLLRKGAVIPSELSKS